MREIFYSKTAGGFYASDIHGESMPADVVGIPKGLHEALLLAQSLGKRIVADAAGYPVAVDPASPPFEAVRERELAAFRALREQYLNRLAGIGVAFMIAGDTEGAAAAVEMRQGLLDLPAHPSVLAATTVEGLRDVMQSLYAVLVLSTPERLRDQFRKVDA